MQNNDFEIKLLTPEEFQRKVQEEFVNGTWSYTSEEQRALPEKYRLSRNLLVGKTFYVEEKSNG